MSDDLVATLHQAGHDYTDKAADLIKAQAARIAELEKDLEGAKENRDELQAVFNKCWKADQGAIKAWQEAHPGNDLVWPDRTKMVVWLLEKENAASARIAELEAALRNIEADCCSDCPPSHGAIKYACRDALEGGKKE